MNELDKSEKELTRVFRLKELNHFLVCSLCDGYFRFAHTISECGHTCIHILDYFCCECLKVQKPKHCPQCLIPIASSFIKKDPFKQNIVDILYPQFQDEDQQVIHRLKDLFGDVFDEISIHNLLKDKDYIYQPRRKKVKKETSDTVSFSHLVSELLGVSMDEFKRDIYDEQKFVAYVQKAKQSKERQLRQQQEKQIIIQKQQYLDQQQRKKQSTLIPKKSQEKVVEQPIEVEQTDLVIALVPLKSEDEKIMKYNWDIRIKKRENDVPSILRLRNFIFKNLEKERCLQNQLVIKDQMKSENIQLYYAGKPINSSDILNLQMANDQAIQIDYEILFKKVV